MAGRCSNPNLSAGTSTLRILSLVLLVTHPVASGQPNRPAQQPTGIPKFEVASIKPCQKGPSRVSSSGDRLTEECVTLEYLIRNAYCRFVNGEWRRNPVTGAVVPPMPLWQIGLPIKGNTGWIKSQLFTINAKSGNAASREMMEGPMMRTLLEDRFLLKIHHEKQEMTVSQLTVAKGGARLQPHKPATCTALDPHVPPPLLRKPGEATPIAICGGLTRSPRGGIDIIGVTMADLCILLSSGDGRVVDGTGLSGTYDIHLDVAMQDLISLVRTLNAEIDPEASEPGGTLADALHKVGLYLQPAKNVVDTLAIDRAQKPADN
jgi:uncharacterized protein (TIGR03435 family)